MRICDWKGTMMLKFALMGDTPKPTLFASLRDQRVDGAMALIRG